MSFHERQKRWKVSTYSEDTDELGISDVAVLVLIEMVEDDAQLLSGQENAQLRHELLKLKLLQHSVLVAVKALSIKHNKPS